MVKSVEHALKTPASELMSAASSPATTRPRNPVGITCCTIKGNTACAVSGRVCPFDPISTPSPGARPVRASARATIPGTMKMKTGSSLRQAAKIVPRRASVTLGAASVRCTMYWSVHQYQRPTIGEHSSIPGHGYSWLKYQAMRPASFTGAHVPSTPAGSSGFHMLNIAGSRAARSSPHPPRARSPNIVSSREPSTRIAVWTASV